MLDLSNNNSTGHDFRAAYVKGGQRRVYLKRCEGTGFVDKTYPQMRAAAVKAKLTVGGYDFLHPLEATPGEAAAFLLKLLPSPLVRGRDLRPCLDCEHGTPSVEVGRWVSQVAKLVHQHTGLQPLIYGSGWWLEACSFTAAPGPLWLAAYGRDDGREYPIGAVPKPWKTVAAHQFTSKATVVGIHGACDLSHVFVPASIDVPKRRAGR